jgi:large repetitive protein
MTLSHMNDQFFRLFVVRLALLLLMILTSTLAFSQNLARHNWYFGNTNQGIRFNRADNSAFLVKNKAFPFGTGGSAVATDPSTANVWFYTDGNSVFDASHQLMLNGNGLTANSSANQPVVVCSVPGDTSRYFIFTSTANFTTGGTLRRSVVNMSLFGHSVFPAPPLGDVENPKNVAVSGLSNLSEGMIIVPHANGTDFWLVTQQNNTLNYSATLINAASYTSGTFTTTTTTLTGSFPITVANFSYFEKTKKLAVSPQNSSDDALILNFNDATGVFAFDRTIFNSGLATTGNQSIYDIEWDPKGQYLYLSRTGEPGVQADVLQYDYLNPGISLLSVLKTPVFRSFGLQVAPDSAIYYLYQASAGGPFLVDRFTKTDTVASQVKRATTVFGAANDFKATQFPSFLPKQNVKLKVSFTTGGTCQNTPINFFPTVTPNADSLHWTFGDGRDTTLWSPVHTYAQAQTFSVTVSAFYQGQRKDTTESVTITAFPLKLKLVQDTTACRCQLPARLLPGTTCDLPQFSVTVKVTGGTATSYQWSNGQTGPTLKPDSAGYYFVVVSDASGCSAYAGVNVKEYGLQDSRENIWYFGNHAGINFNVSPPVAMNTSAMDAPEGCAIACDRNGQVIFYTDGSSVWDKNATPLTPTPIATNIGGDPLSAQSSLIIPVPGDETLFYIFTTQAINGTSLYRLKYSLFDLKKGTAGQVTIQNQVLFSKSTERITGNDHWMIAHEFGNNTFRAYPISAAGIGDPIYSAIGSDHSFGVSTNGEGYMKLGTSNRLVVALSTPGVSNLVELFDFVDSTGVVTNYRKIDLKTPAGQVYGVEVSPGGNKIFATVDGLPSPSEIFEYSIDSVGIPHFKQKISQPAELGAIETGPDGQIYVAVNDAAHHGSLGIINAVEDTTRVSGFTLAGFALKAGTNSRLGLPNFRQQFTNATGGPGFSYTGSCLGDSTHFAGVATDAIDKFQWQFGDGASSTTASPVHLYATPGTFHVSMRLTNRCHLDTTIFHDVIIFSPPPPPTNAPAVALCNGSVVLDANSTSLPGLTYLWTRGDTTRKVTVTAPVFISVTNTDKNGCSSTAQSIVADNRPQVSLGPDVTVCQNSAVPNLDAQNPRDTYVWQLNSLPNGNTAQTQTVNTATTGKFTYDVSVNDPITTCTAKDTVTITVKSSPTFTFTGVNPSGACGTPTGSVTLGLTGPDNVLYSYFINGPGAAIPPGFDKSLGFSTGPIAAQAGVYSSVVSDQISGCSSSLSIGLSDATVSVTAPPIPTCSPTGITVTATNEGAPYSYLVKDSNGAIVDPGSSKSAVPFTTSVLLSAGNYVLQLTSGLCIATANVAITALKPSIPFTTASNVCTTPNQTITATSTTPGVTYVWSGPFIVSGAATSTVTINPGLGGPFVYTVVASEASSCPTTQTVNININTPPVPSFTASSPCSDVVFLNASPIGNYVYRWSIGGTQVAAGQQTVDTTPGVSNYVLTLNDPVTGCNFSTAAKDVSVLGLVTASLSATLACDDGKPFTLQTKTTATSPTYAWSFNGSAIASATSATLDQTAAGKYEVVVTQSICTATASIDIVKFPIPVGALPDGAIVCDDPDNADPTTAKVELDPGDFEKYDWFKNNISLAYTTEKYTATSAGIYKVDLTNKFGCVASDQTNVTNNCEPVVNAPNAFRPASGVTANEEFSVFTYFITDNFQIFIFNRWGEMVYQSNDRHFKWNGNYNNGALQLPGGTYAYVIKYVSSYRPEQGVREKHGGVVLLR